MSVGLKTFVHTHDLQTVVKMKSSTNNDANVSFGAGRQTYCRSGTAVKKDGWSLEIGLESISMIPCKLDRSRNMCRLRMRVDRRGTDRLLCFRVQQVAN